MSQNVIDIANLTVTYGSLIALNNIQFQVVEGEIIAIIGPNGAGKTTMLETIAGLKKQKKGIIKFKDKNINNYSVFERRKMGMFLVPQEQNIFPRMSVIKNLQVCSLYNREEKTEELIDYVFELFPILQERKKQIAHTLSGGQQKMLAVGMGLVSNSQIMLIDEPSIGLAPKLVTRVLDTLKQINRDLKKTIVLSEQNIKVLDVVTRIYGLEAGEVKICENIKNLSTDEVKELYLGKIG